jgi:hypothetical protein
MIVLLTRASSRLPSLSGAAVVSACAFSFHGAGALRLGLWMTRHAAWRHALCSFCEMVDGLFIFLGMFSINLNVFAANLILILSRAIKLFLPL